MGAIVRLLGVLAAALVLGGCATYRPLPLPDRRDPPDAVAKLAGADELQGALDLAALDRLVLANNPELRAARSQHGVAEAQMLQAGLLPNPAASASRGTLVSGSGFTTAWTAALSLDVKSLLTLAPKRDAARATAQSVDAGLLWQEWQTVAKARLLFVDLVEDARLQAVQNEALRLLDDASARTQRSIDAGDNDLTSAAPLLAAAADARTSAGDTERSQLARRHQLAALLGLKHDAALQLADSIGMPAFVEADVREQAAGIALRRPDLIALQLGYRAQEAELRAAVLAQFPTLSIGIAASQDNSAVRNRGPQVGFDVPVFDRNQGGIAVATATRRQLRDEYAARLLAANEEVEALLSEQRQTRQQLDALAPEASAAARLADHASAAWREGNLDSRSYSDFMSTAFARRAAAIALERNLLEQQVALATLLGRGLPTTLEQDDVR